MKGYLLWASALLSTAYAQANEWRAYHGLDADAYKTTFNELVDSGFRLNSISGYESDGEANFAVIFEKRESADWVSHPSLTYDNFGDKFWEYLDEGYQVTQINGYTIDGVDYYSGIWEKTEVEEWKARIGMSRDHMQNYFDKYIAEGYTVTQVSGYERAGKPLFAALWEMNNNTDWFSQGEMTYDEFMELFDKKRDECFRPVDIDGYQKDGVAYYNAIWEKEDGRDWAAWAGLDSSSFQEYLDQYLDEGYVLRTLNAYNVGTEPRFAGIWVKPN